MKNKGIETRKRIIETSRILFEEKGYKDVTMKDICEMTGLSRGGLYCHYQSTEQIFIELITSFLVSQTLDIHMKMQANVSAIDIVTTMLEKYQFEMLDSKTSLTLAIYEYFSNKQQENSNLLERQYSLSFQSWETIITYGMQRGEFKTVDIKTIVDLILFSYQGVRMYSRLMKLDEDIPERIIKQIKELLFEESEVIK